jgi:hypothetical protein
MFPVRYGLNSYINLLRNSVFKGLTHVPLHISTLILSFSGDVIYIFSLFNCEAYINIIIHRIKIVIFYVHLYFN